MKVNILNRYIFDREINKEKLHENAEYTIAINRKLQLNFKLRRFLAR